MKKKLYKSATDKLLTGVLGGIGEYFEVDSTLVRLAYALVTIFSGVVPGVLFYIVCLLIIPDPPFNVEQ